ncbi:MAG: hypothetical protein OEY36_05425 [Gammaproteobacteria bacterium]|nr:hypothetical protein [Gammaproteobacteria bacterium]
MKISVLVLLISTLIGFSQAAYAENEAAMEACNAEAAAEGVVDAQLESYISACMEDLQQQEAEATNAPADAGYKAE